MAGLDQWGQVPLPRGARASVSQSTKTGPAA